MGCCVLNCLLMYKATTSIKLRKDYMKAVLLYKVTGRCVDQRDVMHTLAVT